MKRNGLSVTIAALITVAGLILPVDASEVKKPDTEPAPELSPEMQEYLKLAEPGEHHKHLEMLAGYWEVAGTSWEKPGAEPQKFAGTAKSDMILGGRFLKTVYRGKWMGMDFEGRGIEGYDNARNEYVSSWVDSLGTMIMHMSGSCSEDGKVRTMTTEFADPVSGEVMGVKGVTTIIDDNTHRYESYMIGPDGSEFKNMEMTATKK